SGLAAKFGVTVLNSPGTIDSDYRGEVSVLLANLGNEPFTLRRGDRIAQMIIAPVTRAELREARKLSATKRGAGGFGSTGLGATPSSAASMKQNRISESAKRKQTKSSSKLRAPGRSEKKV
ncbi:MAG: dUTP diphosphatase, partial [Bryobacteraceae bacterium]